MRQFIVLLLALVSICTVAAEDSYLLVLVSQRNAENMAESARQFNRQHPTLKIQARTDAQLRELDQIELNKLFKSSRGILAAGLYGPTVQQLEPLLTGYNRPVFIINSDHRLVALSSNTVNNQVNRFFCKRY